MYLNKKYKGINTACLHTANEPNKIKIDEKKKVCYIGYRYLLDIVNNNVFICDNL